MREKLIEKLEENKRNLLMKHVCTELKSCEESGFVYQFADADQSRQILETVLSNSFQSAVREVDISDRETAVSLILENIADMGVERMNDIVYLFHPYSNEVGAIKCALKDCASHLHCLMDFIDFEGRLLSNSFIVVEPSFSFSVCLFHTEYGCELVCKPPKRGTKCIPFL
ncbi:reverse transcriptase [Bacillus sp. SDLI1]|uniref:Reverse transcriptase n=2 Tax=Bacillaceae TaxID=186817 RepID=A0AAI8HK51_9BACI|nr:reverse transcriptase [Bacillus sp. SDLI1]AUJ75498.1 reverse transcriptase [Bacillus siamensis]